MLEKIMIKNIFQFNLYSPLKLHALPIKYCIMYIFFLFTKCKQARKCLWYLNPCNIKTQSFNTLQYKKIRYISKCLSPFSKQFLSWSGYNLTEWIVVYCVIIKRVSSRYLTNIKKVREKKNKIQLKYVVGVKKRKRKGFNLIQNIPF